MNVYKQSDPRWRSHWLGTSHTTTLGRSGCLLTCLAMAKEMVLGGSLPPGEANVVLKKTPGAFFKGSLLVLDKAAPAVGLTVVERRKGDDPARLVELVEEALHVGAAPLLKVDHDGVREDSRFHYVLIVKRRPEGGYHAADPAPGALIDIDERLCGTSDWGSRIKSYTPLEVVFLGKDER